MKNIYLKFTLSAALLALTTAAFANDACPSVDSLKPMTFTKAYNVNHDDHSNTWILLTNDFSYNDANWNMMYGTEFSKDVKTEEDALAAGNEDFANLEMNDPLLQENNSGKQCLYAFEENNVVMTSSPPMHASDGKKLM